MYFRVPSGLQDMNVKTSLYPPPPPAILSTTLSFSCSTSHLGPGYADQGNVTSSYSWLRGSVVNPSRVYLLSAVCRGCLGYVEGLDVPVSRDMSSCRPGWGMGCQPPPPHHSSVASARTLLIVLELMEWPGFTGKEPGAGGSWGREGGGGAVSHWYLGL